MIEVTEERIYYKTFRKNRRRLNKKVKRLFILTVILTLIVVLFFHVNGAVFNLVSNICEDYTRTTALSAIHNSVFNSLNDEISYSDLIRVEKNKEGNITLMSADSKKINAISRVVAINTEKNLKESLKEGIPIPIFAFIGIKLASGYGPKVKYDAITVASVNCGFDGKFTEMGINQTLHSLYIVVDCLVDIEFLYKKRSVVCSSEILISEAVLVGKVPETYLNGTLWR